MLGKPIVYSLVVVLIAYETSVYLISQIERTEVVRTGSGKLQGNVEISRGGRKFSSFWGIPYAKPPLGNLRFAPPQPVDAWKGVKVADNEGIECASYEFILDFGVIGQEDCLILNVFTPNDLKTLGEKSDGRDLFPVIVNIHGGGFLSGSTKAFKADYFMDRDVVVVTINYRVGALGFLNTGDNTIRGNMGMKDQNLALKWVQNNIKNFGGNPDRVTLMGESAGAVSVHLHILSPLSAGLFQQAIMLSGHALVPWAFVEDPVQQAQRFGENVNCPTMIPSEFLECLRARGSEDMIKVHALHRNAVVHPLENFGPSLESIVDSDTFLSRRPSEILNSNNFTKIPIMAGVNEGEGLFWVARATLDIPQAQSIQTISGWLKALPYFIYHNDMSLEDLKKITKFYFGQDSQDFDPFERHENFTNLFSDRIFNTGLIQLARHHLANAAEDVHFPMYLYYYTYQNDHSVVDISLSIPTNRILPAAVHAAFWIIVDYIKKYIFRNEPKTRPASHGDELTLLFNIHPAMSVISSSRDFPMSVALVDTMYNFAVDGKKMSFEGKTWDPVGSDSDAPIKLMRVDSPGKSQMIDIPFLKRVNFWNSLNI
ncbi:unnamed protein product [Allacma fusca]|uniref:Carboxylic ester hydrolase n=1 Tax=Allacma fusca TaxID=39272 RepID=A0A8J2P8P2_9HEXA|nr:unnamed protein product [Allacma fusca]